MKWNFGNKFIESLIFYNHDDTTIFFRSQLHSLFISNFRGVKKRKRKNFEISKHIFFTGWGIWRKSRVVSRELVELYPYPPTPQMVLLKRITKN